MLMEMNNVSVILAHHTGKERADDKTFMSARGGSVFAGWFDSGIKTPIVVPSSANGGQMVAFEEILGIF